MIRSFEVIKGLDGKIYTYDGVTVNMIYNEEHQNTIQKLIIRFDDGYEQVIQTLNSHQQVPENNITGYLNHIKKRIEVAIDTRKKLGMLPNYINEVFGNETTTTTTILN